MREIEGATIKVIINDIVIYNSDDDTLFVEDGSEGVVTLPRLASEIFCLLIINNGVALSRETILNKIWEERGLQSSGNNLNNYISMLRKVLNGLGCNNVIKTIPKYGFFFEADIKALEEVEKKEATLVITGGNIIASRYQQSDLHVHVASQKYNFLSLFIWALFITLIILSPLLHEFLRLKYIRTEILRVDKCRFYLTDDITRRINKDTVIDRIDAIMKNEKINCEMKTNIYYYTDHKLNSLGKGLYLDHLIYCAIDNNSPCINYVYYRQDERNEIK